MSTLTTHTPAFEHVHQDGQRRHAAASMVPSSACPGSLLRRRTILGEGLPIDAAYRPKAVLPGVSRWGHRVPDYNVSAAMASFTEYGTHG